MSSDNAMYFWCTSGEDGTHIEPISSKRRLEDRLKRMLDDGTMPTFLSGIPKADGGCWTGVPDNAVVIIKGDTVTPTVIQRVTEVTIP